MSYIQEYIDKLIAEKNASATLVNLDSPSKVSIWREFLYVVAFIASFVKELHTVHEGEVAFLIENQKRTNLNHYRTVSLNYRDGHTFDRETLLYTGSYTDQQIADAQIIKRSAANEVIENGIKKIALKLATETNGELSEIDSVTLDRVKNHLFINAPAGTQLKVTSNRPDKLKIEIDVYIDPQILLTNGGRVDGTVNDVVPTAVNAFFADKNFKFDGELVLSLLADKIQEVEGVEARSVSFKNVKANREVPAVWEDVNERYTAYSGYYKIVNLTINYLIKQ